MKTNLQNLLTQESNTTSQILYLIPNNWWIQFNKTNQNKSNPQDIIYPPLNLQSYIDTFLLQYQENIITQLQHKKNNLQLNKIIISPQINKQFQWKFITSELWKIISIKCQIKYGIFTIHTNKQINLFIQENHIQIQIIFSSKIKNYAYIGFLPQYSNSIDAIRKIGFHLGFIQMENTHIIFPDKNPNISYSYHQFQSTLLHQLQDTLLLIENLQYCYEDKYQKKLNFSFGRDDEGKSNEAVAGDCAIIGIQSFQQIRNQGTISTGAQQTPSFISESKQHRGQFRVRQLFREKKPQQIKQLKVKAKNIINGTLIGLPSSSQNIMEHSLDNLVQDLIEHIHQHKKKIIHKQKQIFHQ